MTYSESDSNQNVLKVSSQVLTPKTMQELKKIAEIGLQGWKILDRWALDSPQKLQALEQEGFLILVNRLYQQQQTEMDILDKRVDYPHLTDYELLTEHEIKTTL